MSRLLLALVAAAPLLAHVMSMSYGEIKITGPRATYSLRMPMYEVAHVESPDAALFTAIEFSSEGRTAKFIKGACRQDRSYFLCDAEYDFGGPVKRLTAESRLPKITVPNHIHVLTAERDGLRDQAVLDLSFPKAEVRFDPPTAAERLLREALLGVTRALGGPVQWMFFAALALAGRSRRELAWIFTAFAAGEIATAVTGFELPPRFVEAAMALTVAYLAVEILILPGAGQRAIVAGVLGLFHGLYYAQFLRATEVRPAPVLAAAVIAEAVAVAILALVLVKIRRPWVEKSLAAALGLLGLSWFGLRLLG